MMKTVAKIGVLAALPLMSVGASAAVSWNFQTGSTIFASTLTGGDYEYTGDDGSSVMTLSGWAESPNAGDPIVEQSNRIKHYGSSGLGIDRIGESNPQHATDNSGPDEFFVFDFGASEVSITEYRFGWTGNDYDSTLLYWNGPGDMNANTNLTGKTIAQLSAEGWAAAGHYSNDSSPDTTGQTQVAGSEIYSSYWAIGAFMGSFTNAPGWSTGNDYFKLKKIVGKVRVPDTPGSQVPTPAPLALMAAGLFLLRRRLFN